MRELTIKQIKLHISTLKEGNHGQSELRTLGEHLNDVFDSVTHDGSPTSKDYCNSMVATLDELATAVAQSRGFFRTFATISSKQVWSIGWKDAATGERHQLGHEMFEADTTHQQIESSLRNKYWDNALDGGEDVHEYFCQLELTEQEDDS
jgi:hypothetical protein